MGLRELNVQMSKDAVNLTKALKGDSKKQGDWGELQLEILLEKSGLSKDIHYNTHEMHQTIAELIRKQWQRELGISISTLSPTFLPINAVPIGLVDRILPES